MGHVIALLHLGLKPLWTRFSDFRDFLKKLLNEAERADRMGSNHIAGDETFYKSDDIYAFAEKKQTTTYLHSLSKLTHLHMFYVLSWFALMCV